MTKQEANKLILESVEIAEYEYMIFASQLEPFGLRLNKQLILFRGSG